ncbi:hypothetical protein XvhCFBP2543_17255 [Xanthomonas vasicola]|uniref:Uncharacterized protein n=1 Tax=Xanthomonas vasicola TaxID=56459 RepID=A0ABD7S729_XANVA|nr:hypothetical protein NX81_006755 [Xanthomonas vasicola]PPV01388.1 hypothetical protein XvhCFBP2543_17255 [Xanthomonas vasicola]TWQ29065.1 hypothetical protein FQJ97_16810 [Xanthomonas vasicola]TWQ35919.1 hypothetical protein FQJ96_17005 [Xanthomonas vasicola]TWQ50615.1 hypothetical protein FQK01_17695 [Xanthomonas vasicola]
MRQAESLGIGRIAECAASHLSTVWNLVSTRPLAQQVYRCLQPITRRYHAAQRPPTIGNMELLPDWLD